MEAQAVRTEAGKLNSGRSTGGALRLPVRRCARFTDPGAESGMGHAR